MRKLSLALLLSLGLAAHGASEALETGIELWHQHDSNLYPQVAADFRRALAADPQNPDLHSYLGRILLDMGEVHDAAAELKWCFGFRPRSASVIAATHLAWGQCWELQRRFDKAAVEYQKAHSDEAAARLAMTKWHHLVRPHCIVVWAGPVTAVAETAASACDAAAAKAMAAVHVSLSEPVLIYAAQTLDQLLPLGVQSGTIVDGRQQIYELADSNTDTWQSAVAHIVSYHIAATHCTDPIIRYGTWTWMLQGEPSLPLESTASFTELRAGRTWDARSTAPCASFVAYLVKRYGNEAFSALWAEPDSAKGAAVAYHKSFADLETEWRASLTPAPAPGASSSPSPSPAASVTP